MSFTEAVSSHIEADRALLNTSMPAKIVEYNPVTQKCVALPLVSTLLKDGRVIEFTALEDVPVIFPGTNNSLISFPLNVDDTVLLVFCQRSLDKWLSTGDTRTLNPEDFRKHDLSDAVAIPGLFSFPRAINDRTKHTTSTDTDALVLIHNVGTANENSIVLESTGGISMKGDLTVTGNINSTATITGTTDVVGGGKSLKGHTHTYSIPDHTSTTGPTSAPI